MNIAILGHVDHGKSTLIGRLLYDSGAIPESRLSEMQAIADQYRRRFEFGYFMDAFTEEIRDERTVDTSQTVFKGEKLHTIIDVPGHKEFTTAMLTGTCHADAAVLVVDVTKGLEEQTRRHLYLARMLGIKRFILAVNKMDLVDYDKAKYLDVIADATLQMGNVDDVVCVPISAYCGDNVYHRADTMLWLNGSGTLVSEIDKLETVREIDKPLRFVVQDNYDGLVVGRVESGELKPEDYLAFVPSKEVGRVSSIETYQGQVGKATVGDCVGLRMWWSWIRPQRGDVAHKVCELAILKPSLSVLAKVIVLKRKLQLGETVVLRCGTGVGIAKVKEIKQRLSSETGAIIKENTKSANEHEVAMVEFALGRYMAIEPFDKMPALGRITLAQKGHVVGAGIVENTE